MSRWTSKRALACAVMAALLPAVGHADADVPGTWQTSLQARDLDGQPDNGPEAYYDATLNLTWLVPDSSSTMTWQQARDWAAGLNVHGTAGWRLPVARPVQGLYHRRDFSNNGSTDFGTAGPGAWGTASELGHLY